MLKLVFRLSVSFEKTLNYVLFGYWFEAINREKEKRFSKEVVDHKERSTKKQHDDDQKSYRREEEERERIYPIFVSSFLIIRTHTAAFIEYHYTTNKNNKERAERVARETLSWSGASVCEREKCFLFFANIYARARVVLVVASSSSSARALFIFQFAWSCAGKKENKTRARIKKRKKKKVAQERFSFCVHAR